MNKLPLPGYWLVEAKVIDEDEYWRRVDALKDEAAEMCDVATDLPIVRDMLWLLRRAGVVRHD